MKTIIDYLETTAQKFPDKILFGTENDTITCSEFIKKCKLIATQIAKLNIKNSPVVAFDNRNINTLIGMIGTLYSGNYYVVLDVNSPIDRSTKILDTVNTSVIILQENNLDYFHSLETSNSVNVINFDDLQNFNFDEKLISNIVENIISTDIAYLLFTSGSTGTPKGTIITHSNIINYISWYVSAFGITENTTLANQAAFYFSVSVSDIYTTLFTGATMYIIPKSYFSFPVQLINYLNEKKVNLIYWVPSALCLIANMNLFDYVKPLYLKEVHFAGEIMPNKQLNYWRRNFPDIKYVNLFGPTETTDICTYYVVNRQFKDEDSLPIGKHCENCDTFVVNENNFEVKTPNDGIGELYVRGAFIANGYYDNIEKTKDAFVQNPLHNHYPEIVYRTGDLVKINKFGEYEYAGRKDFQIKHHGYRIELGEIETNVGAIPNVNSIVCVYDEKIDNIIMIYQGKIKEDELLETIKTKVPMYMVPEVIIKLSQLPLNQNGKIDRKYLKANYLNLMKK